MRLEESHKAKRVLNEFFGASMRRRFFKTFNVSDKIIKSEKFNKSKRISKTLINKQARRRVVKKLRVALMSKYIKFEGKLETNRRVFQDILLTFDVLRCSLIQVE